MVSKIGSHPSNRPKNPSSQVASILDGAGIRYIQGDIYDGQVESIVKQYRDPSKGSRKNQGILDEMNEAADTNVNNYLKSYTMKEANIGGIVTEENKNLPPDAENGASPSKTGANEGQGLINKNKKGFKEVRIAGKRGSGGKVYNAPSAAFRSTSRDQIWRYQQNRQNTADFNLYHPSQKQVQADQRVTQIAPQHRIVPGYHRVFKNKESGNLCKCIQSKLKPVDPNEKWDSRFKYDALFLGPTHHFVRNHNATENLFLHDETLTVLRPEVRAVECISNLPYPNEPNVPRVCGPRIVSPPFQQALNPKLNKRNNGTVQSFAQSKVSPRSQQNKSNVSAISSKTMILAHQQQMIGEKQKQTVPEQSFKSSPDLFEKNAQANICQSTKNKSYVVQRQLTLEGGHIEIGVGACRQTIQSKASNLLSKTHSSQGSAARFQSQAHILANKDLNKSSGQLSFGKKNNLQSTMPLGERDLFKVQRYTMQDTYDYHFDQTSQVRIKSSINYGKKSSPNLRFTQGETTSHTCDNMSSILPENQTNQKGTLQFNKMRGREDNIYLHTTERKKLIDQENLAAKRPKTKHLPSRHQSLIDYDFAKSYVRQNISALSGS